MKRKFGLLIVLMMLFCPLFAGCFGGKEDPEPEIVEIYFYDDTAQVELNKTLQLQVQFRKNSVKNKSITWSSSDESAVSVDENGVVTGLRIESYVCITATSSSGHSAYCYVKVVVLPTSISFSEQSITLFTSKSVDIDVLIEPYNCTENSVEWTSSNPSVASAFGNTISASWNHPGIAILTATTDNGLTASIEVIVEQYVSVQSGSILVGGEKRSKLDVVIPVDQTSTTLQLQTEIYPSNASIKTVEWSSTNESVASVDKNGLVSVQGVGYAIIYAEFADGRSASLELSVIQEVVANSISLSNKSLVFIIGDAPKKLNVSWDPTDVTYQTVEWSSSNNSVAKVDENGLVSAVGVGNATISATTKNGIVEECSVEVKPQVLPTQISLNESSISIQETKTFELLATILPENATSKTITWESSDESVASVENGVVTGISVGNASITATTSNGFSAECKVEVTELIINVGVYVDGELTQTLQTCRSKDYLIDLPEKPNDKTTNSSLNNYFYGWFGDENFSTYLNGNEKFESDSAIYAKNVQVLSEENASVTNSSGLYYLSGLKSFTGDVLVVSQTIGSKTIDGFKANCITNSNIKTLVILGFFTYENASISNCPNLERVLVYNYASIYNDDRDKFAKATISNCPNVKYNELGEIKYLGTLDDPYMVAIEATNTSITELTVPDECFSIGNVLGGLLKLKSVKVEDGNLYYSSQSGVLYNKAQTKMVHVPRKLEGEVVVPNTITEIGDEAFCGISSITSLNIGTGVRKIGADAFNSCTGITQITGGNSLLEIGSYAFIGCSNLTSVKLSAVKSIGNYAFSGCRKLAEFNFNGIETINSNAFYNCGFKEVNIPSSATYIGSDAFALCTKITSVTLPFIGTSNSESSTKFPFGIIFGTTQYASAIETTQYYIKNGQSYSSRGTYYIPSTLKSITINGGNVNYGVLSNLVDVEVELNNVEKIEKNGFLNSKITKLTLDNSLVEINGDQINGAFSSATIGDVYFNGTVEDWLNVSMSNLTCCLQHIANNMFVSDKNIKEITQLDATNVTVINDYSLYNFTGLLEVTFNSNILSIGEYAFNNCSNLKQIILPASLESIGDSAFRNCSNLESVEVNSNLQSIGSYAFAGNAKLKNINLKNVSSIGSGLFSDCSALESVELSNPITSIPSYAFQNCSALKSFNVSDNILSIGSSAFKNCTSLTSFELPQTLETIEKGILGGCSNLNSLTIYQLGSDASSENRMLNYYFYSAETSPINLKSLTIQTGVIYINALNGWASLTDVVLENVSEIQTGAFANCTGLENLFINSSIADFNDRTYLFSNAGTSSSGINITFGKNVSKVPNYFLNNGSSKQSNIAKITFEENSSCEAIGDWAFTNSSLHEIDIPATLTSIGSNAFYNCANLKAINVDSNNEVYSSVNGNLFSKDATNLIQYASGSLTSTFEITSNISSINANAFYGATNIKTLTFNTNLIENQVQKNQVFEGMGEFDLIIGENVETIPAYMFSPSSNGLNIKSISFAQNSKCNTIGISAFAYAPNIKTIDLPACVIKIKANAFDNCIIDEFNYLGNLIEYFGLNYGSSTACPMNCGAKLTIDGEELINLVVPESITSINYYLFCGVNSLESVTLHNKVKFIGGMAFAYCSKLKELHIPSGANALSVNSLAGLSSLESLTLASLETNGSNALFGSLFSGYEYENSVKITQKFNYVSSNSSYNFYLPKNLKNVNILSGSIGNGAFSNISTIPNIVLGSNVQSIGSFAFYNCSSLTQIDLPNISSISSYAFANCSNLTQIDIPNSVESVGDYAFNYCPKLEIANIGEDEESLAQSIGEYAFENCGKLKQVNMFNITSIGSFAFSSCHKLKISDLPASLVTLNEGAFDGCLSIYSIKLHNKLETAGKYVFSGCSRLVEVYNATNTFKIDIDSVLGDANPYVIHTSSSDETIIDSSIEDFKFTTVNGTKYLIAYEGDGNPNLPTDIGNYRIRKYAFANLPKLTELILPSCVVGLETRSIYSCPNLEYISATSSISFSYNFILNSHKFHTFNFNGSLEDWLKYNFATLSSNPMNYADEFMLNGEKISSLTVPNTISVINANAFYNFTNLTSITINSNVIQLGNYAFKNCYNLVEVNLASSGVKNVGLNVFENCKSLTSFVMPATLKTIGIQMFAGCSSLTSITFNNVLETIETGAFENCTKLVSAILPDSVKVFGSDVFAGCSSLENLTISNLEISSDNSNKTLGYLFGTSTQDDDFNKVEQTTSDSATKTYYIPKSLKNVHVRNGVVVYGAFQNCAWIESVTLGDGVSFVGANAFDLNSAYVSEVDGVYYVGNWVIGSNNIAQVNLLESAVGVASSAFANTDISTFSASPSLKYINSNAFENCNSLSEITLNEGLLSIGDGAFISTDITEITLPNSLLKLGTLVFDNCKKLTNISVPKGNSKFASVDGNLYSKDLTKLIQYAIGKSPEDFEMIDSVVSIEDYAFKGSKIKGIYFNSKLSVIGEGAFYDCQNLSEVTLPANLTSIGEEAFYNCSILTSVVIKINVDYIGARAFASCDKLETVSLSFKNWKLTNSTGTIYFDEADLTSARTNATFLGVTYCEYAWSRNVE